MIFIILLIAAAAGLAVAAAWTRVDVFAGVPPQPPGFLLGVSLILSAAFLQYVFYLADIRGPGEGALIGAGMGAFVVVPWLLAGFELHREAPVREELSRALRAIVAMAAVGAALGFIPAV